MGPLEELGYDYAEYAGVPLRGNVKLRDEYFRIKQQAVDEFPGRAERVPGQIMITMMIRAN